jgi:hypothetical protein
MPRPHRALVATLVTDLVFTGALLLALASASGAAQPKPPDATPRMSRSDLTIAPPQTAADLRPGAACDRRA